MLPQRNIPELLDDDLGTPEDIATSLADLRRINRWFGGISTTEALLSRVAQQSSETDLSILEVGGASGDSQRELKHRFEQRGIHLRFTILDRNPSHMNGTFAAIAGDALELPFAADSFDVVSCALLMHHLQPPEIVRYVSEALHVCRKAVVINDLRRATTHLALIYAGMPLFRSRITRHDSVASVYRSYTSRELANILRGTFPNRVEISSHYLFRMGAIVWK